MRLIPASDSSLLVVFGEAIAPEMSSHVLGLFHALQSLGDQRIRNLHPGYVSLLVDFDPLSTTHDDIREIVEELAGRPIAPANGGRSIEIPICYGAEFGPDLPDVATYASMSIEDVVGRHANGNYEVCFLGFTAGFAYLGGMPLELSMPRLPTPRRQVEAGSVGIAGGQTGIYPTETPGGWRLIGRTPLRMFNAQAAQPTLLMPGDQVRFLPIDRAEFERLRQVRA
jgi:inhibitor of KinA